MGHALSLSALDIVASLPYLLRYRLSSSPSASSSSPSSALSDGSLPPASASCGRAASASGSADCVSLEAEVSRLCQELSSRQQHAVSLLQQIVQLVRSEEERQQHSSPLSASSSSPALASPSAPFSSSFRHEILELMLHFAEGELGATPTASASMSAAPLPAAALLPSLPSPSADESFTVILQKSSLDETTKHWLMNEFQSSQQSERANSRRRQQRRRTRQQLASASSVSISSASAEATRSHRLALSQSSLHDLLASGTSFQDLDEWSFDIFAVSQSGQSVVSLACCLFHRFSLFQHFAFTPAQLFSFLSSLSLHYCSPPYHSFLHAVDVLHCVYLFIIRTQPSALPAAASSCTVSISPSSSSSLCSPSSGLLSPLDILSLLIAAVCHDVAHPGLSNNFLIASSHPLALLYNDTSVLEHMHCATTFRVLSETGLLDGLQRSEWLEVRRRVIGCILATDLAHHFDMLGKLDELFAKLERVEARRRAAERRDGADEDTSRPAAAATSTALSVSAASSAAPSPSPSPPGSPTSTLSSSEHLLLLSVLLHSADVSNACKPFPLAQRWSDLLLEEFALQGDEERSRGLELSPYMDRGRREQEVMSLNFIDFLVAPLMLKLTAMWPALRDCGERLKSNRDAWWQRWQERVDREDREEDEAEKAEKLGGDRNGQQPKDNEKARARQEQRRSERERRQRERQMLTSRAQRFAQTFLLPPLSPRCPSPLPAPMPTIAELQLPAASTSSSASVSFLSPLASTQPLPASASSPPRRPLSPSLYRFPSAPIANGHRYTSSASSHVAAVTVDSPRVAASPLTAAGGPASSSPPSSFSASLHRRSLSHADIVNATSLTKALRSALQRPDGALHAAAADDSSSSSSLSAQPLDRRRRARLSAVGITREMMMIRDESHSSDAAPSDSEASKWTREET